MDDPGEGEVRDANCEDLRKKEDFNQHFQMLQKIAVKPHNLTVKECGSIHNHMNDLHSKLCPLRAVHNHMVGFCFFSRRGQISP